MNSSHVVVLDTGVLEPEENMAIDEQLLKELDPDGAPLLHLYDWASPSATYGHFIPLERHVDTRLAAQKGVRFARRPTGGGIVFHIWDLAFSFLMPANHSQCSENTLENYKFVNKIVLEAIDDLLPKKGAANLLSEHTETPYFCMTRPTIYDVLYLGKKIAGSAQRRTKRGYLHQGTISLIEPDFALLGEILRQKKEVLEAMASCTFTLFEPTSSLASCRELVRKRLSRSFAAQF